VTSPVNGPVNSPVNTALNTPAKPPATTASSYASTATLAEVAARIAGARHVQVITHRKPDGDALGSLLALVRAFHRPDRPCEGLVMGDLEPALLSLAGATPLRVVERDPPGDEADLVLVVDTGAWAQLAPLADWLRERAERVVGIDHHARGDEVAPVRIVEPTASSTTMILVELLDAAGVALRPELADPLYAGLATDTGWFRFSNAGPAALRLAARLVEAGADKSALYARIEEQHRPPRLALFARALASIEWIADGRAAIQSLGPGDFEATGGDQTDIVGLVNQPLSVGTVRAAALLVQTRPGEVKISLRSKPRTDGEVFVDVNEIAARFGGGGHVQAAGARIEGDLDAARAKVAAALEAAADG